MKRYFFKMALGLSILGLFGGCNSSSSPTKVSTVSTNTPNTPPKKLDKIQKATLLDGIVKGAKYICEDLEGVTDKDGVFEYIEGKSVKFYAGNIFLGEAKPVLASEDLGIKTQKVVTPLELTNSKSVDNEDVIKLVQFLIAIDSDGDISNGIDIDESKEFLAENINIQEVENLEEKFDNVLEIPNENIALAHVKDTLKVDKKDDNIGVIFSTQEYEEKWFNRAKAKWNEQNPDNKYEYSYYNYQLPADTDMIVGNPPDAPISPEEWMKKAGIGFSKTITFPYEDSRFKYTDAQIKEWKAKGLRNGRFHLPVDDMVDLDLDPTGATLNQDYIEEFKSVLQLFVDNNIPVTVSFRSHGDLINDMVNDREEVFRRIIDWWRQISSSLKDMSYLVAFENFVEYHGFDDVLIEKKDFKVELDNNETHYEGFKNYRKKAITNWVRTPGYNNLMAEISRVVRITNPKRVFLYKPHGIGRAGMVDITPWRWGPEGDYLQINNQRKPYWLISVGGSANISFDYIKAQRTDDEELKEELLATARKGSWGPAVDYYNATHTPVWISLFGIKAELSVVDKKLNGVDITTDEVVDYVDWYLWHIQNDVISADGKKVSLSAGFQQSRWVWNFENQSWFEGTLNDRWENFEKVGQKLSEYAKKYDEDFIREN
jgi:hypothetical protein